MARAKGKFIVRPIGAHIYRIDEGKQIVQIKPYQVHQTEATKRSASLFGKASKLALRVRDLMNCCYDNYDRRMSNRSTSVLRHILSNSYNESTDTFHFVRNSFNRLVGFEFNIKSLLVNYISILPVINLQDNKLFIHFPEIEIPVQLKFPTRATSCQPNLAVGLFSPETGYYWRKHFETAELSNKAGIYPGQDFEIDVPEGTICIVGLGLTYYTNLKTAKIIVNNNLLDPAGICAAFFNQGVFSLKNAGSDRNNWHCNSDLILAVSREANSIQETHKSIEKERKPGAFEIAREMLNDNEPMDKIVKYTKLTLREIEELI